MKNKQLTMSKGKNMKKKKYYIIFGIALVCAMIFTSCDNITESQKNHKPNEPEIQTPIEDNYGRISINLVDEEGLPITEMPNLARTILPSINFDKYEYTFTKAGEAIGVPKTPDSEGFFTLEVGNYTVAVQAYTGNAEPYTLAANGLSAQFGVGPGINAAVKVPLTAVAASVKGKLSYTVTYPAGAAAEINLQKWPEMTNEVLNPITLSQGNGITQTLELDESSYLLTVLVNKTGLYAGISEALHINSSLTTVFTKNFEEQNLLAARVPLSIDYTISGTGTFLYNGSERNVSITPKSDVSPGAVIVYYEGTGSTAYPKSASAPVNVGTYNVTFDVAAVPGWVAAEGLPAGTITIDALTWGIRLSDASSNPLISYIFPNANPGYAQQAARTINVSNTGNQATGSLTVSLSGTNASSFTLSVTSLTSIPSDTTTRTFTVRPNNSLSANTVHSATVIVSGDNGITASFTVSFTVNPLTWSVRLSDANSDPLTSYIFPAVAVNYAQQTARSITVTNTGNQATGALTVALSGASAGSFTLSVISLTSITSTNGTTSFTVRPNNSLAAGTYIATVTVSGGNGITASFTVNFTVIAATYGISLSQTAAYTFPSAMEGYGTQTARTTTITNTGNQATGALTVALAGTNASSFTLSATTVNSIAANGTATFTVRPNNGLAVGTYTATVTVSGDSNITAQSFGVNFTVTVDPSKIIFGQQYSGSISSSNTSQKYNVVLTEPGRLTVNLTQISDWIHLTWFDNTNTAIRSKTSITSSSNTAYMDLEAGTYYIEISQYINYTATYNLTATFAPANNTENEPNNTFNTADTIMSGEQVRGFISYQDDEDWYRIVMPEPGRLTLNIAQATNWIYVTWYDNNSTIIRSRYYVSSSSDTTSMDLEAGTYYFQISKYYSDTGTYNLSATTAPAHNNEKEPNQTLAEVQTITFGEQVRGFISYQDDEDWYRIVMPEPGRLTLNIAQAYWIYVTWYDNNSTIIRSRYNVSSSDTTSMDLEAGTYYFQISKYGSNTGTYNLSVTTAPAHNNEKEPNNAIPDEAQLIVSGELVKGFISHQDDIDLYRVVLSQAGQLSVNIANANWIYVTWYDNNGVIIRSKYYVSSSNTASMDLAAGTYYIQIEKYSNDTGTYTIRATFPSSTIQTWYTVTYNANNGSGAPSIQVKNTGANLTLSSQRPTRTNYTFLGWATTSGATTAQYQPGGSYTANADVTLYAVWQALPTYTITYNANNGLGAPASQTKTQGTDLTLSSTVPTRTNFNFLGWANSSSASVEQYRSGGTYTVDAAVTLYAVWHSTASTYTITFDANGGTGVPASQTKTHGTALILDRARPTRSGSVFMGWAATNNATTAQYSAGASYTVEANRTLYAVWQ